MLAQKAEHRTMGELLKLLGFTTPLIYATAAYGLFHWLDENASDEAKAALARTMRFKDYKDQQVASALVEVFDRIYTYPLLRWRAFGRSLLFTTVVSVVFVLETTTLHDLSLWIWPLLFNFFTDYLSLFVIRTLLIRSGTKPVIGLVLGAVSGVAIVIAANFLRIFVFLLFGAVCFRTGVLRVECFSSVSFAEIVDLSSLMPFARLSYRYLHWIWPALAVFIWLPLFALGIVTARLLTPLAWMVGKTQWFLKEGKEHPLKAIGYVAAAVVFLGTVAGRAVFSA
ncbi:hypothetical protein [Bradyrhizobium sp. McL0616]|uniref:hypothetical protein n=1 Tax=Bradyrhizobium sp. McL0616 TaxID=3415674 RepID=UPI003CF0000A